MEHAIEHASERVEAGDQEFIKEWNRVSPIQIKQEKAESVRELLERVREQDGTLEGQKAMPESMEHQSDDYSTFHFPDGDVERHWAEGYGFQNIDPNEVVR